MNTTGLVVLLMALPLVAQGQDDGPGTGQGWLGEFNHSSRQLVALAETTPAEKFTWRPAAGVRSISEVYMHIAIANFFLLRQAGAKLPADAPAFKEDTEKKVRAKAEVLVWLRKSFDAVRTAYPAREPQKRVSFFGRDTTTENVYIRLLVHNHEHMGQSIAYARLNGIVPPWSK
jgi:uncharacterized damage-inducible protein DinB